MAARASMRKLRTSQSNITSTSSSSSSSSSSTIAISRNLQCLKLLHKCRNTVHLFQIHAHLLTSGLFRDSSWPIKFLKHTSRFEDLSYTVSVFRSVDKLYCVNTIIKAYSISSYPVNAVKFYFEMVQKGFVPDSYTFVSLFGTCAKITCLESGEKCHGQAVKSGVDSVLPVQNSLVHFYCCCGFIDLAKKVFVEMLERDVTSWNTLMDGTANNGDLSSAHDLFDKMLERNVVSWNIMISAYLKAGNPGCSLKLFRKMMKIGSQWNERTMVFILTACGRSASAREGRSVHATLVKKCFHNSNTILDTALIDMYCKCKKVDVAQLVFDKMGCRNLVSWNAMILGHCLYGRPEDGLSLFQQMFQNSNSENEKGEIFMPDEITFIGVFCACARLSLLTEGRKYFTQMVDVFRLKPNFAHFWCMANLYVSVGLNNEAEEILRCDKDETFSSESIMWADLLCHLRFKGDVALGERIAHSLINKEPHNFSYYRLLLNVYAVTGQWQKASSVKERVKEIKMGRIPGCGLIDLKEIAHEFKGEPNQEEVLLLLNQIKRR